MRAYIQRSRDIRSLQVRAFKWVHWNRNGIRLRSEEGLGVHTYKYVYRGAAAYYIIPLWLMCSYWMRWSQSGCWLGLYSGRSSGGQSGPCLAVLAAATMRSRTSSGPFICSTKTSVSYNVSLRDVGDLANFHGNSHLFHSLQYCMYSVSTK